MGSNQMCSKNVTSWELFFWCVDFANCSVVHIICPAMSSSDDRLIINFSLKLNRREEKKRLTFKLLTFKSF